MLKKAYKIASVALVLIAVAFLIFYYSISSKTGGVKKSLKEITIFNSGSLNTSTPIKSSSDNTSDINTSSNTNINVQNFFNTKALQVYDLPVVGFGFNALNKQIVWAEKETGQIFGKDTPTENHINILKNLNPDLFNVTFTPGYALKTYLNDNFSTKLSIENISNEVYNLDDKIEYCSVSNTENSLFCAVKGSDVGIVKINLDTTKQDLLYSTNLSKWNIQPTEKSVYLTQYPSNLKEGVMIKIYPAEKLILSGYALQTKVSPDDKYIIYSILRNGSLETMLYSIVSDTKYVLPITTIANKCVFAQTRNGIYCAVPKDISNFDIDNYNLGVISSNDSFYFIDIDTLTAEKIVFDNNVSDVFDVDELRINKDENMIGFINKIDSKPWVITLPKIKKDEQVNQ